MQLESHTKKVEGDMRGVMDLALDWPRSGSVQVRFRFEPGAPKKKYYLISVKIFYNSIIKYVILQNILQF